jgi:hypothetical protein
MKKSKYFENLQAFEFFVNKIENESPTQGLMVFVASKDNLLPQGLEAILQATQVKVFGALVSGLIYDAHKKSEGILAIPLDFDLDIFIQDLSKDSFTNQLENYLEQNSNYNTLFCFVDATSTQKNKMLDVLYNASPLGTKFLGAGAGTLDMIQKPCVFSNLGVFANASVIAMAKIETTIGVAHGWHPITTPIKVTQVSNGTTLTSLNWEPALKVYCDEVKKHAGVELNESNFADIAKSYPFGMIKMNAEMVVRDPYAYRDNAVLIVDEIPEGTYINIMHGDKPSLLEGASKSVVYFSDNLDDVFCVNCISRVLYWGEDFDKELDVIGNQRFISGILSIGEIANNGDTSLELYNKTIVVAQWK